MSASKRRQSKMSESGHGMQVVKVLEDHTYQLDEKLLEQILMKDEVKNLPVVVVSVAGAYRGGKSFLLNFFIRYLMCPQSARDDGSWLGEGSDPLVGFSWRGGSARNTTGILLWSEPFINTLPSGEKVAVILMDTQGTFDSSSTIRDNSTIFALSTLLSSVQIYNLFMNIKEDDLQYLQLFTMYGKMAQEHDHDGKVFQTLEFLVRDWPYPYDYPFGATGGSNYLEQKLAITPDQHQELKDLRTHIRSCFEKVLCFLMPHPGFKVLKPTFKGNINEIEPDFRNNLKELLSSLLSTEKMAPKIINGQKITAGELFNYFKAYMKIFNSGQIPNPKNIMQATVEAGLLSSTNEARHIYETGMNTECGPTKPAVSPSDSQDLHSKYLAAAKAAFTNKRTMATAKEVNTYLNKLSTELENRLPQFEQSNLSKLQAVLKKANDIYDETIHNVTKNQALCLHPLDLDSVHDEAVQAATKFYDESVKKVTEKPDQKRTELSQSFYARLVQLKTINDKNNRDAVKDAHTEYLKFMETKSQTPPISDGDFRLGHEDGLKKALAEFQSKRNRSSSYPTDIYKEDLMKTINDTFWRLQAINLRKIDDENTRKEQEKRRIEDERIREEQQKIREEQQNLEHERQIMAINQEKNKAELEKRQLEDENERLRKSRSRESGNNILSAIGSFVRGLAGFK